jgi:type IV pilus assembly protein PilN
MIRINLLPQEERIQKKAVALPRVGAVVPFVVLALFIGGILALTAMERARISGLKRDIARAEEEARRLKPQIDKINELTKKREELNTRLQIIQDLDKGRFHSVRVMDEVAQDIPQYLWLAGIRDQGATVNLDGVTFSNLVVADLMMRVEDSDIFEKVDLVITERGMIEERQVIKFTITAQVTPGATSGASSTLEGPMAALSVLEEEEDEDGR